MDDIEDTQEARRPPARRRTPAGRPRRCVATARRPSAPRPRRPTAPDATVEKAERDAAQGRRAPASARPTSGAARPARRPSASDQRAPRARGARRRPGGRATGCARPRTRRARRVARPAARRPGRREGAPAGRAGRASTAPTTTSRPPTCRPASPCSGARPRSGRPGPRPGLTLEQIADAGIALADAEGLDAVSMARLAESLGFTTMSLYRYVSSKDEVLEPDVRPRRRAAAGRPGPSSAAGASGSS